MATRGRKSLVSLATQINAGAGKRLSPPKSLNEAEIKVWQQIVDDQPAGAFTATHTPLLEMYCRHVVNNRILADELLNFDKAWLADDDGLRRYDALLKMSERESRAASSLATRLRITRQAIDHPTTAGRAIANDSKLNKPWDPTNPFANNGKRPPNQ